MINSTDQRRLLSNEQEWDYI